MIRAETPNKVPMIYGIDSIHGATYVLDATLFPQQIAAGRDAQSRPHAAQRGNLGGGNARAAVALDIRASIGRGRHPVWARFAETFGEDPFWPVFLAWRRCVVLKAKT